MLAEQRLMEDCNCKEKGRFIRQPPVTPSERSAVAPHNRTNPKGSHSDR